MWGEKSNAERYLPEVLTVPTKIIILLVTRVTARATVDTPRYTAWSTICPELFAEHGEEECYSIIKYCSVPFVL